MAQSTLGIKLYYAIETSAGTVPTTGWTEIGDMTDLPEYDAAPTGIDCTPISETESHRYVPGLKDPGNDWSPTMNMTQANVTAWNTLSESAVSAAASDKKCWFCCVVPNFTDAWYLAGVPAKIGWAGASVDEVFAGAVHVTVNDASKGWDTKPTIS